MRFGRWEDAVQILVQISPSDAYVRNAILVAKYGQALADLQAAVRSGKQTDLRSRFQELETTADYARTHVGPHDVQLGGVLNFLDRSLDTVREELIRRGLLPGDRKGSGGRSGFRETMLWSG